MPPRPRPASMGPPEESNSGKDLYWPPGVSFDSMIQLSVMYPNSEGMTFDLNYYRQTHLPMMRSLFGDRVKGFALDCAATGSGLPAPYAVIGHILFDSLESMKVALDEHGPTLIADIPNYTNVQPVIQVSKHERE